MVINTAEILLYTVRAQDKMFRTLHIYVFTAHDVQYVLNACTTHRTNCQLLGIVNVRIHRNTCSVYSAQRETRTHTTKCSVRYGCIHKQYEAIGMFRTCVCTGQSVQ